jgi:beta-ribofuranosylaminobenzene 5'-phosphate synthase
MTRVCGYPRLHAALFDLGTATLRQYGGIGFAIDGPRTTLVVDRASHFSLSPTDLLDDRSTQDLSAAVDRFRSRSRIPAISINIEALPPQHVGLGTKTTLVLCVLKAIQTLAQLDLERTELQGLSGRGGTSGIGVHVFFDGGLIIDGGHRTDPPRTYLPSSSRPVHGIPPVIARVSMPETWTATLVLPSGERRSGSDEATFFSRATPVPNDEIREAIALAVVGLGASAAAADFETFISSLNALQKVGFKAREVAAQPATVSTLLQELSEIPMCGVGMSSMGPLLFAITKDAVTPEVIAERAKERKALVLGTFGFRNMGFDLE